jgi:hypothetical protein
MVLVSITEHWHQRHGTARKASALAAGKPNGGNGFRLAQRRPGSLRDWCMMTDVWWLMDDDCWMMDDGWWMMVDGWWMTVDGWWMMSDGWEWWLTNDGWWMMIDEWWMMTDEWWLTNNDWWMTDDEWWLMNDGWWMMTDEASAAAFSCRCFAARQRRVSKTAFAAIWTLSLGGASFVEAFCLLLPSYLQISPSKQLCLQNSYQRCRERVTIHETTT